MDWRTLYLIAGALFILAFLLDIRAEENRSETLKDLFLGLAFLAWYAEMSLPALVFVAASVIVYYPEMRKQWIRRRYG
ncbi:hypothetical protein [Thermococcus camini]|uniref:Uncharacterized protein n=1 Tax=Thermococcus camini TaxID=2016373 RepID=A0A7G2D6T2_9EURY|nr:hypothetical protein [Thermococcus camini]CAD5243722.1 conserved protein of unknown function [Thermococcus camini]